VKRSKIKKQESKEKKKQSILIKSKKKCAEKSIQKQMRKPSKVSKALNSLLLKPSKW
jgi:hypothetical protein